MEQKPSTIFEDFQENPPRRRRAMLSIWLKIYVWGFMLFGLLAIYGIIDYFLWSSRSSLIFEQDISFISILSSLLLPVARLLSGILILTERRWAILFALVVSVISIFILGRTAYRMLALGADLLSIFPTVCWIALEIPFIVLLLRVKKEWEKKVL